MIYIENYYGQIFQKSRLRLLVFRFRAVWEEYLGFYKESKLYIYRFINKNDYPTDYDFQNISMVTGLDTNEIKNIIKKYNI